MAKQTKATAKRRSLKPQKATASAPSQLIDARIEELGDWRGKMLARVRSLIKQADPHVVEEWKWRGVPVWSHDGIICTGETYKSIVKLTFAKGASIDDPTGLFNASLEGNTRRAIDIAEGAKIDGKALKALVRAAVALNTQTAEKRAARSSKKPSQQASLPAEQAGAQVKLLSGGNPQIAKADGDAPVQAYIAAMPGWKRDIGRRLDRLVERGVPKVRKAVRWNSPFYGVEGLGWFMSYHVFTRYVKVTFFNGTALRPVPPGGTLKSKEARWVDIHEGELDEAQMAKWIKQSASLPGWVF